MGYICQEFQYGGRNYCYINCKFTPKDDHRSYNSAGVSPLSIVVDAAFSDLSFTPQMATSSGQTVFRFNGGAAVPSPGVSVPTSSVLLGTVTFNSNSAMTFPVSIGSTVAAPSISVAGFSGISPIVFSLANTNLDLVTPANGTPIQFNAPLPIELYDFSAEKVGEKRARLNWSSASEINASHFEIEKSYDADNFEKIGEVKAAGNSQTLLLYEFYDDKIEGLRSKQILYYRLKMVDLDGTIEYSDIRGLNFGNDQSAGVSMYPNPTSQYLNLDINKDYFTEENGELQVFDALGKLILSKK
ncbi:MAG: T9SS type A sorting domain-containing protein [Saprospiraceae bacterium]|nr:T9SS type A sorting domain-containing protein [Saprospiraceae bacterium]